MRKIFISLIAMFSLILIWINGALYSEDFSHAEIEKDIILQQNFIENELKNNNAGEKMQEIFPEGFVFIHALYGLTWCDLVKASPKAMASKKSKALKEALFAYDKINTLEAMSTFDSDMTPYNGIFYIGWKNYLLSNILEMDTTFTNFERYKADFEGQCEVIKNTLKESNSPYLESYPNQSWPADMSLAMASLKKHDLIFKPKYEREIKQWIIDIKAKLDPVTKLIPHKVKARTGLSSEGARGGSTGLIIKILEEIDPVFAKQQYDIYKTLFVSKTFGLPSVSEYPKGQNGSADVDSGPIIFGVGFSGTIFSIGTFAKLGDYSLSEMQYKAINAFGFANKFSGKKKYLFGNIPIADAFIDWGRTSQINSKAVNSKTPMLWGMKFHLISILGLGFIWILLFYQTISKKMMGY